MFWRMVASSILRRRSRVLIAVLAVAIGATTLSGLATIAIDVPAQMAREVRSYGANLVVSPAEDATSLSEESLESISDLITPGTLVGSAVFEYRTLLVNDQPFVSAGTDLQAVRAMREGGPPSPMRSSSEKKSPTRSEHTREIGSRWLRCAIIRAHTRRRANPKGHSQHRL